MSAEELADSPFWYVIRTHTRQEDRADSNLRNWQIETFVPKIKARRNKLYSSEPVYYIKPLFPRYIFARFTARDLLHKVRFTRGVHSIVSFDQIPAPVPDEVIAIIRSRIHKDGLVTIGEQFNPGDYVIVSDGPFKNFTGIFEREMKDDDRVMILLNTVGFQARYLVERERLKRLG